MCKPKKHWRLAQYRSFCLFCNCSAMLSQSFGGGYEIIFIAIHYSAKSSAKRLVNIIVLEGSCGWAITRSGHFLEESTLPSRWWSAESWLGSSEWKQTKKKSSPITWVASANFAQWSFPAIKGTQQEYVWISFNVCPLLSQHAFKATYQYVHSCFCVGAVTYCIRYLFRRSPRHTPCCLLRSLHQNGQPSQMSDCCPKQFKSYKVGNLHFGPMSALVMYAIRAFLFDNQ